jgi:integrase
MKQWSARTPCYGRFWIDTPAGRKPKTIALGKCSTISIARQRLREHLDREGVNSTAQFHENTTPATTFRQQSEKWIASLSTRTRKPVKPATISGWQQALNAWVLPNIGNKVLSEVSNGVLRELVGKMAAAGLAPKTIVNYTQVVKLVVASAVNDEGDQIYPRTWNHNFIGLPIVQRDKQHRPTVTETELESILAGVKKRYAVLFALLAGTGLRIGEALALKPTDFGPDCRVIHVRRSIWHGQEQEPKTANAIRTVDVPEELARILRPYVATVNGYLFAAASGKPLQHRNVLHVLHGVHKIGVHAFRRFRLTWLRKNGVPKDLERFWMGHAPEDVGDLYSKLKDDVSFRSLWCEKAGLGFSIVPDVSENVVAFQSVKVA